MHVLCYGITPERPRVAAGPQRRRRGVRRVPPRGRDHRALAHPFYAVGAPLTARHRRRLAQLFPIWETRNGSRAKELNLPAFVYIETHGGIAIGGSDDHAGIDIGRTFTETPPAAHARRSSWPTSAPDAPTHAATRAARRSGPTPRWRWRSARSAAGERHGGRTRRGAGDRRARACARVTPRRASGRRTSAPTMRARCCGHGWRRGDRRSTSASLRRDACRTASSPTRICIAARARIHERKLAEAVERRCWRWPRRRRTSIAAAVAVSCSTPACRRSRTPPPARSCTASSASCPSRRRAVRGWRSSPTASARCTASPGRSSRSASGACPGFEIEVIGTDPGVDRRLSAVSELEMPFYDGLTIGVPSLPAVVGAITEGRYDLVHVCSPGPGRRRRLAAGAGARDAGDRQLPHRARGLRGDAQRRAAARGAGRVGAAAFYGALPARALAERGERRTARRAGDRRRADPALGAGGGRRAVRPRAARGRGCCPARSTCCTPGG